MRCNLGSASRHIFTGCPYLLIVVHACMGIPLQLMHDSIRRRIGRTGFLSTSCKSIVDNASVDDSKEIVVLRIATSSLVYNHTLRSGASNEMVSCCTPGGATTHYVRNGATQSENSACVLCIALKTATRPPLFLHGACPAIAGDRFLTMV